MRKTIRGLCVAIAATGLLIGVAPAAHAADSPASLTMQSDPGDFFGGGDAHAYTRPQDQIFANVGYNQSVIYGLVYGLDGSQWTVDLAAPDNQPLHVGEYADAQGAPSQQAGHPGIAVNNGFTCQTVTGSFDVIDLEYTNGTLSRLDATFEEHCNNATAALTGEFLYTPSPVLPQLALAVTIDNKGKVDNTNQVITASGTVTCNQYVYATVDVDLTQKGGGSIYASSNVSLPCTPGVPAHWTIYASTSAPFQYGKHTDAYLYAFGHDGYDGTEQTSSAATTTIVVNPFTI